MVNQSSRNKFIALLFILLYISIPASCQNHKCDREHCQEPCIGSYDADQVSVIAFLGDSNIWLATDSCNNPKGWATWFNKFMTPEICYSVARSGASWSHTDKTTVNKEENIGTLGDNNVIYNQVLRLFDITDSKQQPVPDLIMVSCGGNDGWFANKRPHEFDLTVDQAFLCNDDDLLALSPDKVLSLPGAIRYNVLRLQKKYPNARIFLVTPTPMAKVAPALMEKISVIIEQSADRLGVYSLRLDNAGVIDRDLELKKPTDTYDGTHTSVAGAEKVGKYAAQAVKSRLGI